MTAVLRPFFRDAALAMISSFGSCRQAAILGEEKGQEGRERGRAGEGEKDWHGVRGREFEREREGVRVKDGKDGK
jgi:hypothetical protein